MKDVRIHFNGDDDTVFDFRAPVEGKAQVVQKVLLNIATERGSDPLFEDRGTNLLRDSINGLTINKTAAQHTGNFAAVYTKTFILANMWKRDLMGNPERLTAINVIPIAYDPVRKALQFDTECKFADDEIEQTNTTVNG